MFDLFFYLLFDRGIFRGVDRVLIKDDGSGLLKGGGLGSGMLGLGGFSDGLGLLLGWIFIKWQLKKNYKDQC